MGWLDPAMQKLRCLSLLASAALAPWANAKTNVVLIVADDMGYADVGVHRVAPEVRTPNIDALATGGARFTNGYVSCPVCSPSRAGFLTGRYQQRFGHEANPIDEEKFGLPLDQVTLADEFKRAGYVTAVTGKWHLGHREEFRPQRRGFDEFYGFLGGMHGYADPSHSPGPAYNALRRGDVPVADEKEYLTDALTREATTFIERRKSQPFFLYVPYNAVHTPLFAPSRYREPFAEVGDPKRKMELAMLAALDAGVGKIVAKLRDAGLEEETLIIFISDNGGPTPENASSNAPFRGFKGQLWEGGIRVPFMMQWKGHIEPGRVIDHPVISLDIFPTSLAAAGQNPRGALKIDGVNLLPWMTGARTDAPHEALYWRFKPQWAIRQGTLKLVSVLGANEPALFDLAADPSESRDLSQQKPELVKQLREKFQSWNSQLMEPRWAGKQEGAHYGATQPSASTRRQSDSD